MIRRQGNRAHLPPSLRLCGRRGPRPLHAFSNLTFSYYIFSKNGCLLSFMCKKWNFTIFAQPTKLLGFTWKILVLTPLDKISDSHAPDVWLIVDSWWTLVLSPGSTKLCSRFRKHFRLFALKYFLAYTSKAWLPRNVLVQLSELGEAIASIAPPATRLLPTRFNQFSFFKFCKLVRKLFSILRIHCKQIRECCFTATTQKTFTKFLPSRLKKLL